MLFNDALLKMGLIFGAEDVRDTKETSYKYDRLKTCNPWLKQVKVKKTPCVVFVWESCKVQGWD